jgi:hypothetical protein
MTDRYRITTPMTPRCPGTDQADFERAVEVVGEAAARRIVVFHDFKGCSVWRRTSDLIDFRPYL